MAEFVVEFEAIDNAFGTEFEGFTPVSDGGFERGYQDGYADALSKRTDLVVTENGEYAPSEGSTGFKNVKVDVAFRSPMDDLIEGNTTEISSGVSKIADKAFYYWRTPTSANFPNATEIGAQAFYECRSLTSPVFPNVESIYSDAFYSCESLTIVNFPKVKSLAPSVFRFCYELKIAKFPELESITGGAFYSCIRLESIYAPKLISINGSNAFDGCRLMESFDFPKLTSIGSSSFVNCSVLKTFILRSETLCKLDRKAFSNCYHFYGTVNSTYNPNGDKDGYFYVPRALLSDDDAKKDYRRATNWSEFATQFRALEDYTVDGTTTGELDPNKI